MKTIKNKFLIKLIASICLFLTLFNFAGTSKVYAGDKVWGGVLINPIIDLLTGIGDTVMEILHESVQAQNLAIIKVSGTQTFWEVLATALAVLAAVLVAAVIIAVVVAATGGVAAGAAALAGEAVKAAFVAAAGNVAGTALIAGVTGGILAGVAAKEAMIPEDIYLPAFTVTAEEIFRNDIALFDVNFFNPNKYYYKKTVVKDYSTEVDSDAHFGEYTFFDIGDLWTQLEDSPGIQAGFLGAQTISIQEAFGYSSFEKMIEKVNENLEEIGEEDKKITADKNFDFKIYSTDTSASYTETISELWIFYTKVHHSIQKTRFDIINKDTNELYMVIQYYSNYDNTTTTTDPAGTTIYSQKLTYQLIQQTSEGGTGDYVEPETEELEVPIGSTAENLRGVVSKWYYILRNIALLVLMLVLIYIGIRIVIGSTAGEKAKYKERLMDWLVAMCLLFIMHYIMVFAVEIVEKITELVGSTVNGNSAYIELTDVQEKNAEETLAKFNTIGNAKNKDGVTGKGAIAYYDEDGNSLGAEHGVLIWPTDLAGLFRIESQLTEDGTSLWAGYSFCYFVLVLFTLFFAWTYLKRVLYMAFLTMIAPLVAMTYPIDKITDGKAQAFDAWLKEYIFNLLIQPLHLLLYTVLVGSAFELASKSPIYALVAIGFMMPAEKLMRRFFGFEKARTPGLLGGAAGAAIAMTGLQKLMGGSKHKGKNSSGDSKEKENSSDIKFSSQDGVDTYGALMGGNTDGQAPIKTKATDGDGSGEIDIDAPNVDDSGESGAGAAILSGIDAGGIADYNAGAGDPVLGNAGNGDAGSDDGATGGKGTKSERTRDRLARTIKGVSSAYKRGLGKKVLKRVKNGKPIRSMLRGAAGLLGGTLFGAAGLAFGIAAGDPSKAFQYTTTGVAGGYQAGKGFAGAVTDTFSVSEKEMEQEAKLSWFGEEYKDQLFDQQQEDDLMSEQNINYLRTVFGCTREEAEEFLDSTGRECYKSGVRDVEDMAAISKTDIPLDQAIAATKLKNNLPQKIKNMSNTKLDQYRDTYASNFAQKLKERYPDLSDAQIEEKAKEYANNTIRLMKTLDKEKSNLTQV